MPQDLLSIQILQALTYCLGFVAIAGACSPRSAAFDSSIDFSGEVFEGSSLRWPDDVMSCLNQIRQCPEICFDSLHWHLGGSKPGLAKR